MQQGTVVGLGGLKGSGKDTVADYLVKNYGFVKMGMSDPLHEAMLKLDPQIYVSHHEFGDESMFEALNYHAEDSETADRFTSLSFGWFVTYTGLTEALGYTKAKEIKAYREALQKFGTDVVRDIIDKEAWTRLAGRRINEITSTGKHVVMTGIRFENELKLMTKLDAATLYVVRPQATQDKHASEKNLKLSDFQYQIANTMSLDHLYATVDKWADSTLPHIEKKEKFDDFLDLF